MFSDIKPYLLASLLQYHYYAIQVLSGVVACSAKK